MQLLSKIHKQEYIRGDRVVAYGRVMEIMSIINSAGYVKVALITQNLEVTMERINFNSSRLTEFLDNLNPNNSGIFFNNSLNNSIICIRNSKYFEPKNIYVPNIVPIEILIFRIEQILKSQKLKKKKVKK